MWRAKLVNRFDYQLIGTAEQTGYLGKACIHIAEQMRLQYHRVSALRAAFWFPNAILVIGLLAALFIEIAADGLTPSAALGATLPIFLFTLLGARLFLYALSLDSRIWLSLFWPFTFVRHSNRFILPYERLFLTHTNWLFDAGLNHEHALRKCEHLINASSYSASIKKAANRVGKGESLSSVLSQTGLVLSAESKQTILHADATGTHSPSIEKHLKLLDSKHLQLIENENAWLPRIYYVIVLLAVANMMVP